MNNKIKKQRTFFKTVKKFLYPIILDPWLYVRGFLLYGIWPINPIAHILFLQKITYSLETGDKILFKDTLIYYIIFIIIYESFNYLFRNWGRVEIGEKTQKNIHRYYLRQFIKLDNNKIETIGTGRLISIIEKGLLEWGRLMNLLLYQGIPVIFSLVFTIYMLLKLNYLYGIIFISFYIFFHVIGYYLNKNMIKYRNGRIAEKHNYAKQLIKIIMSKFEILQSSKIDKEVDVLDKCSTNMIMYNRKMVPFLHTFFMLPEAIVLIMKVGIFFILGTKVINGDLSISILVGLSGAILLMDKAIDVSLELFKNITKDFYTVSNMWELFDKTKTIDGYENKQNFKYKKGEIEIKKANFGYTKKEKIFKDFNLKISGGKITAFVGESGGGKSTLIKLLSGYIKLDSGEILIDKQKLSKISLKSYYKSIGYLTQEPSVFDGTILDNLTYAVDKKLEEKEIKKVIKLARCDFIKSLPKGINTQIGERGVKLSGGQKQRLAIAKVFLKDPKIIMLDEPTSALDSFSEEQITKAMQNLFRGRTVIIIAHRLQTVKHADEIILIEEGKILERGTHNSLVKLKGKYKKMLDLQSGF